MVRGARQRVALCGIEQLERLAGETLLGPAEDKEEQQRADEAGREGDGHDPDPAFGQLRQDRGGVAPQGDNGVHVTGVDDRKVLAQHRVRVERRQRAGLVGLHDCRVRLGVLDRARQARCTGGEMADAQAVVTCQHSALGSQQGRVQDPAPVRHQEQAVLQRSFTRGAQTARLEVGLAQVEAHEAAHRCRVRADRGVKQGRRRVGGDERGLTARRRPDDHEEGGKHEDQQSRPRDAPAIGRMVDRRVPRAARGADDLQRMTRVGGPRMGISSIGAGTHYRSDPSIRARISGPYRSSLAGPMPRTRRSAGSVRGRASAISRSVASWATT